jgi:hypothetical protein
MRKNAGSGSVSGSALNQCGSETLADMVKTLPGDGKRSVMRIAAVHAFTSHPPKE